MNRINEIGDTPRGQYMLGRLSQSYGEPNLYSDDYDEVPEIADYASRNWRKDGNARAFDLGKGDEAKTKWVDDGNQRNFRKMYNLPQFENKQNNRMDVNKKLTKLRETSGYDDLKMQAIDRFRSQDPMTLSNSELRSAIDYMLAYRWALEGDEDVLNEYIEAFKMRSINNTKNESRYMVKKLIRLTEEDLHRIVKESVEKVLRESEPDLYDTLARPNGELDMSNPYTWAKSPKMLKDMGYDENGMKNGKKYYDHLLNPNWRFNKRSAGTDFALNEPMGDQKSIRADIANMAKKQSDADARWQKAADSRPLHRKGSPNRDI